MKNETIVNTPERVCDYNEKYIYQPLKVKFKLKRC